MAISGIAYHISYSNPSRGPYPTPQKQHCLVRGTAMPQCCAGIVRLSANLPSALPRRMDVYAKAACAAVLGYMPAAHHDVAAGFADCNQDAQRECRPHRRFRFICRCCACITHSSCICRMFGTKLFIGPTQLAAFHLSLTRTSHCRTRPAWPCHAQLTPITAT